MKVWLSLIPARSWPKWKWGLSALAMWWEARDDKSRVVMSDQDYVNWVHDVFQSGKSMAKVRASLNAIDAWPMQNRAYRKRSG